MMRERGVAHCTDIAASEQRELERHYRGAKTLGKNGHFHLIWLVAQGYEVPKILPFTKHSA